MDETSNEAQPIRKRSFLRRAAWYSLITPFVMAVFVYGCFIASSKPNSDGPFIAALLGGSFLVLVSSLLAGVVGLFAAIGGSWKMALVSLFGVLASVAAGFLDFYVMLANAMGRNC